MSDGVCSGHNARRAHVLFSLNVQQRASENVISLRDVEDAQRQEN